MPSSPASEGGDGVTDTGRGAAAPETGPEQETQTQTELAEARDRNAELEDRYKRALADLDNYRKRSGRELDRRVADARDAVLLEWLDVLDNVERALRMEEPGAPAFAGMRAVLDQMESVLGRQGVTRTGTAGEPFDPERHEAVEVRATDDVPDRTVVDVARSGFSHGDRMLRPAQVVVARPQERPA
jgi:molecular chaperone GrpE